MPDASPARGPDMGPDLCAGPICSQTGRGSRDLRRTLLLISAQLATRPELGARCSGGRKPRHSRMPPPVVRGGGGGFGHQPWRTQRLSRVRSSCASRTDASISTRLIETLSTLIPNGTPSVRQYVISSVAVVRACWYEASSVSAACLRSFSIHLGTSTPNHRRKSSVFIDPHTESVKTKGAGEMPLALHS